MTWDPENPIQKQKRIAWEVATSTAVVTREDPVLLYEKLMDSNKKIETKLNNIIETNESQISGNA
jgi:hypothetical protein